MPTDQKPARLTVRSCLFVALVTVNLLLISWVLFQSELGIAIRATVSYGDYRELVARGVIDVEALEELRGRDAINQLHVFRTEDLAAVSTLIRTTTRLVVAVLVLDLLALFAWGRKRRPAG